jgi:predicted phage terminase large subunit-like protein
MDTTTYDQLADAFMQDPGSAGVGEAQATARALDGFDVRYATASGNKETRAKPISAQAEAGNVKVVRGIWNAVFLRVLENFPAAAHDDEVDALSGAHETLSASSGAAIGPEHRGGIWTGGGATGHHFTPRQWPGRFLL